MSLDKIIPGRYSCYYDGDGYVRLDGEFTIDELRKLADFLEENEQRNYILTVKPDAPSNTRLDWILEAIEKMNDIKVYRKNAYNKIECVRATKESIKSVEAGWGALLNIREMTLNDCE